MTGPVGQARRSLAVVLFVRGEPPGAIRAALAGVYAQHRPPGLRMHVLLAAAGDEALDPAVAGAPPADVDLRRVAGPDPAKGIADALAGLPPACGHVAFLGAGDAWTPDHLARAFAALDRGADLYLADLADGDTGRFAAYPYLSAVVAGAGHPSGAAGEHGAGGTEDLPGASGPAAGGAATIAADRTDGTIMVPAASLRATFLCGEPAALSGAVVRRDLLGGVAVTLDAPDDRLLLARLVFAASLVGLGTTGARRRTVDAAGTAEPPATRIAAMHRALGDTLALRRLAAGERDLDDLVARILARQRAALARELLRSARRAPGTSVRAAAVVLRDDPATLLAFPWFAFWFRER